MQRDVSTVTSRFSPKPTTISRALRPPISGKDLLQNPFPSPPALPALILMLLITRVRLGKKNSSSIRLGMRMHLPHSSTDPQINHLMMRSTGYENILIHQPFGQIVDTLFAKVPNFFVFDVSGRFTTFL